MNSKTNVRMAFAIILALGMGSVGGLAQDQEGEHARAKKVFTNSDLQKYQDGFQSDSETDVRNAEKDKVSNAGKANTNAKGRSYWADRLREAENGLGQKRMEEQRFIGGLAEFQKRFAEAKTEFQKKTAQWQVEDTENNLTRAAAERQKAQEEKANVVAEAAKKGFKAEDLKKEETTVSKQTQ